MLKLRDLIKDPNAELGSMMLIDVEPAFKYDDNNNKTETIVAYTYTILLPDKNYEKLKVKINNTSKLLDVKDGEIVEVFFTGLELYLYKDEIKARATGISAVKK
jgi:hypothetical protein